MANSKTLVVSAWWLVVLPLVCAVAVSPLAGQGRRSLCNPRALGRAVVVDTTMLNKTLVYEGSDPESTEGVSVSAFFEGDSLRVLSATYLGELGRGIDTYYLLSTQDYVVEHTELYYSQPIYEGEVSVVSRFTQYFYFCEGVPTDFSRDEQAESIRSSLEEFLSKLEKR
jgi:hypothetical protein